MIKNFFKTIKILILIAVLIQVYVSCNQIITLDKENESKSKKKLPEPKNSQIKKLSYRTSLLKKNSLGIYLTMEEKKAMIDDSIKNWNEYILIAKKRGLKYEEIPNVNYLTIDEALKMIIDSVTNWDTYHKVALRRKKREINHKEYVDSLKNIIHPIDSVIPFGPNVLLQMPNQINKKISFTSLINQPLSDIDSIIAQKQIFEAWTFFLELNEIIDNSTNEDSYGKFLPAIDSYDFILEDPEYVEGYRRHFQEIDLNNSFYSIRIGDIEIYEVYYYIQQIGDYFGCHPYDKLKVEECCYTSWFDCNYEGYIILYNRTKRHAKIIHTYYTSNQSFRFFSVSTNNTINLYQGYISDNRDLKFEHKRPANSVSMGFQEEYTVKILVNGETLIQTNNIN